MVVFIQSPLQLFCFHLSIQLYIVSDYVNESFHDEKLFERELIKEGAVNMEIIEALCPKCYSYILLVTNIN